MNPADIQKYIDTHGIYNVFFRQQDPYTQEELNDSEKNRCHDIHLLKSFILEKDAVEWILKNG